MFEQEEVIARVRVHLQLKKLTESLEEQVRDRTAALQQAQVQLVQQEKLSTLGELVAGVAHEINNPISFIANNIAPLQEYVAGVTEIIQLYQQAYPNPTAKITNASEELDLEFALEDMAKILESLKVGTERIQNISVSLRTFSRSDCDTKTPANLHEGIDSTLMILQHRIKDKSIRVAGKDFHRPRIQIIKRYGRLSEVNCYPGQMNQVFMNILATAIDAIDEAFIQGKMTDPIPQIQIATAIDAAHWVALRIADNGIGMPESVKQRLFEPLFTTKPVGRGTGLGLPSVRQIVVEKHNGKLEVNSQPGRGTEFIIRIPTLSVC